MAVEKTSVFPRLPQGWEVSRLVFPSTDDCASQKAEARLAALCKAALQASPVSSLKGTSTQIPGARAPIHPKCLCSFRHNTSLPSKLASLCPETLLKLHPSCNSPLPSPEKEKLSLGYGIFFFFILEKVLRTRGDNRLNYLRKDHLPRDRKTTRISYVLDGGHNQRQFCSPGNIWKRLETFLIVALDTGVATASSMRV